MKKDLGKSYGETSAAPATPEKYYPSTSLEADINVPKAAIDKDIEVRCIVRICRKEEITDKKGTKSRLELEFRKIDFGTKLDSSLEEDITDAIEDINSGNKAEDLEFD